MIHILTGSQYITIHSVLCHPYKMSLKIQYDCQNDFHVLGTSELNFNDLYPLQITDKNPFDLYLLSAPSDCVNLTHRSLNKMVAILQTIFLDVFSWVKIFVFWLK